MHLVDEHSVVLMSVALAVLKSLTLAERFFVLSFVKANAVSLTAPLMKGQARLTYTRTTPGPDKPTEIVPQSS